MRRKPPAKVFSIVNGGEYASPGNPDKAVVDQLEMLLAKAKDGQIAGLAYAITFYDGAGSNRYVGTIGRTVVGHLFGVMTRISRQIDEGL